MDEDLLRCLLAAFPTAPPPPPRARADDAALLIRGYRVPFESTVDDALLGLLAERRHAPVEGPCEPA